ncbi:MAG: class I SAM-dependent methyltransferase [Sphingomicrobium sp.]
MNIGSSTGVFRSVDQPHVGGLFERLQKTGVRVVHCDLKEADGVDEVGDVLDPAFQDRMRAYDADVLLCSNLLEHLTDPKSFAAACGSMVRAGGHGLFTVPYSYPYHADPIDTMFRPTPDELVQLLPGWQIDRGQIIEAGRFRPRPWQLVKHLGRVAMPFYRSHGWRSMTHRLLWLFRPYRQTMLLARKPG